jgi:hypothetical protein
VAQSVNALATGLAQIEEEIQQLKVLRVSPPGDEFISVMQVYLNDLPMIKG